MPHGTFLNHESSQHALARVKAFRKGPARCMMPSAVRTKSSNALHRCRMPAGTTHQLVRGLPAAAEQPQPLRPDTRPAAHASAARCCRQRSLLRPQKTTIRNKRERRLQQLGSLHCTTPSHNLACSAPRPRAAASGAHERLSPIPCLHGRAQPRAPRPRPRRARGPRPKPVHVLAPSPLRVPRAPTHPQATAQMLLGSFAATHARKKSGHRPSPAGSSRPPLPLQKSSNSLAWSLRCESCENSHGELGAYCIMSSSSSSHCECTLRRAVRAGRASCDAATSAGDRLYPRPLLRSGTEWLWRP